MKLTLTALITIEAFRSSEDLQESSIAEIWTKKYYRGSLFLEHLVNISRGQLRFISYSLFRNGRRIMYCPGISRLIKVAWNLILFFNKLERADRLMKFDH